MSTSSPPLHSRQSSSSTITPQDFLDPLTTTTTTSSSSSSVSSNLKRKKEKKKDKRNEEEIEKVGNKNDNEKNEKNEKNAELGEVLEDKEDMEIKENEKKIIQEVTQKMGQTTIKQSSTINAQSSPSPNNLSSSSNPSSSSSPSPNFKSTAATTTTTTTTTTSSSNANTHYSRLCRNVTIYGFCKNEAKGCKFFHPSSILDASLFSSSTSSSSSTPSATTSLPATIASSSSASSSSSSSSSTSTSSLIASANEFLPNSTLSTIDNTIPYLSTAVPKPFFPLAASHRSLVPPSTFINKSNSQTPSTSSSSKNHSPTTKARLQKGSPSPSPPRSPPQKLRIESPSFHPHSSTSATPNSSQTALGLHGAPLPTSFALPSSTSVSSSAPPSASKLSSSSSSSSSSPLIDTNITQAPSTFLPSSSMIHPISPTTSTSPHSQLTFALDPHIQIHTFVQWAALEPSAEPSQAFNGYLTQWYKAMSIQDGMTYAVLRLKGFKVSNVSILSKVVDKWKVIRDPGIVRLHEAFTSTLLDQESSLYLVYDYHPQARPMTTLHTPNLALPTAMSPFFQLASTLLRYPAVFLHATKVLVQPPFYRINGVGVADFLGLSIPPPAQQLRSVLMGVQGCQRVCQQLRSASVKEVLALHAHGLLDEVEHWRRNQEMLEWELRKSKENDRLARLLIKLNFITERPEYLQDPSWSETGDRYFLKLFRDYVFHMVDEHGKPSLDLGHVIASLNKLDAGVPDQVVLTSRDDRNYLIVSYAELKKYLDAAFMELLEASQSPLSPSPPHS